MDNRCFVDQHFFEYFCTKILIADWWTTIWWSKDPNSSVGVSYSKQEWNLLYLATERRSCSIMFWERKDLRFINKQSVNHSNLTWNSGKEHPPPTAFLIKSGFFGILEDKKMISKKTQEYFTRQKFCWYCPFSTRHKLGFHWHSIFTSYVVL